MGLEFNLDFQTRETNKTHLLPSTVVPCQVFSCFGHAIGEASHIVHDNVNLTSCILLSEKMKSFLITQTLHCSFSFLFNCRDKIDEGPTLETLDYTIRIGIVHQTFLYFNIHICTYHVYIQDIQSSEPKSTCSYLPARVDVIMHTV